MLGHWLTEQFVAVLKEIDFLNRAMKHKFTHKETKQTLRSKYSGSVRSKEVWLTIRYKQNHQRINELYKANLFRCLNHERSL